MTAGMASPASFLGFLLAAVLTAALAGCGQSPNLGEFNAKPPPLLDQAGRVRDPAVAAYIKESGPFGSNIAMGGGASAYAADACRVTCAAVSAHLYAPGTARFSPPTETTVGGATGLREQDVTVEGYVDAQNTAGAFLRAVFNAEVVLKDGQWTVKQLIVTTAPGGGQMIKRNGAFSPL